MPVVIVGDCADPHVASVASRIGGGDLLVFDASSLPSQKYLLTQESCILTAESGKEIRLDGARGWMRRLAPAGWVDGDVAGSHRAVAKASLVSLLSGVARTSGITWLTDIDPLLVSESKLVQIRAASRLGIDTPRTIVTNDRDYAIRELGPSVVIKPLGPGHFTATSGKPSVVYATHVDLRESAYHDLGPTPFLIQEHLAALTHFRIVTVGSTCWAAMLPAGQRSLDWRADPESHHSFLACDDVPHGMIEGARAVVSSMGLGYSSQDWIQTSDGRVMLLDVNPAGQWLFLPEPISSEVSSAIAGWLEGR